MPDLIFVQIDQILSNYFGFYSPGAGNSGLNVDLPENATYPVCFPKVACAGMVNAYTSLRAASR